MIWNTYIQCYVLMCFCCFYMHFFICHQWWNKYIQSINQPYVRDIINAKWNRYPVTWFTKFKQKCSACNALRWYVTWAILTYTIVLVRKKLVVDKNMRIQSGLSVDLQSSQDILNHGKLSVGNGHIGIYRDVKDIFKAKWVRWHEQQK